jgi:hypothetical protein
MTGVDVSVGEGEASEVEVGVVEITTGAFVPVDWAVKV